MARLVSSSSIVRAGFGLALVMLAGGCPLLEVDVEVPEVCVTHKDVEVAGVPAGVVTGVDETFAIDDLSAFDALLELDADAHFVSATLRASKGVATLAFIDAASVQIASNDPESTLPTRMIYACDGDCPATDGAIVIPAQDQLDALEYVRSGSLSIALQASGTLPAADWTMDVEICVAARASYAFEP
jgi:hypothetical protein